jgi:hypothetical protein
MENFMMLAVFAVIALLVAWVVNGLVGLLSGERPQDTGSLWLDIFSRFFAVLELGFIGRILSYVGLTGLPRRVVLFIGLVCLLSFLVKACHHTHTSAQIYSYPVQPK